MVTEAERLKMHLGLQEELGEELGNLLMEHLPPTGWGDVARKDDVLAVKHDVLMLKEDIGRVDRKINWIISLGVTVAMGLFALQAQVLLTVSRL